jgi:hypothetical protein
LLYVRTDTVVAGESAPLHVSRSHMVSIQSRHCQVGMHVSVVLPSIDGVGSACAWARVTCTRAVHKHGLHTVLVRDDALLVNGVLASSYEFSEVWGRIDSAVLRAATYCWPAVSQCSGVRQLVRAYDRVTVGCAEALANVFTKCTVQRVVSRLRGVLSIF